jgi:plasmid maintenance system antidote protein VapI
LLNLPQHFSEKNKKRKKMKLKQYLETTGIPFAAFAKRLAISVSTLKNIVEERHDLRLSIALRIEALTFHQVTCKELLGAKFKKNIRK